jgi:hypothetical protein
MPCILRFVQRFLPKDREVFMKIEAQFAKMERRRKGYPKGRRSTPYSGREEANTLIWECEFPTLKAAQDALALMAKDPGHEKLYKKQVPYMQEAYTEIYEVLDF